VGTSKVVEGLFLESISGLEAKSKGLEEKIQNEQIKGSVSTGN
jgi:hypothetical protein